MIVDTKQHPNNLLEVVFPQGQTRTRRCSYSAIPSVRRPVGNLPKSIIAETGRAEQESKMISYQEFKIRRNIAFGLVVLVWVVACLYFYIVGTW